MTLIEIGGAVTYAMVGLAIARRLGSAIYWGESHQRWGELMSSMVMGLLGGALWGIWIIPRLIYMACDGKSENFAKVVLGEPEDVKQRRQLEAKVAAASISASTDLALQKLDEIVIDDCAY